MDAYKSIRAEIVGSNLRDAMKQRLVLVLDGIQHFVIDTGDAYVDQASLAIQCRCGPTTIKKATRELADLGYLEVMRTKRLDDNHYHWNSYRFVYPPVVETSDGTDDEGQG